MPTLISLVYWVSLGERPRYFSYALVEHLYKIFVSFDFRQYKSLSNIESTAFRPVERLTHKPIITPCFFIRLHIFSTEDNNINNIIMIVKK